MGIRGAGGRGGMAPSLSKGSFVGTAAPNPWPACNCPTFLPGDLLDLTRSLTPHLRAHGIGKRVLVGQLDVGKFATHVAHDIGNVGVCGAELILVPMPVALIEYG